MSKRPAEGDLQQPLKRPKSLEIDSLIEALDVQNLWFPARVIKVDHSQVLLHFLGWSDEWDEWIERDSTRLRQHRGWGTPAIANDWQKDSVIEALDMEGKWYPATVIYVASHSVMVHYHGWSSKWNEWLKKDSGRLRRRHSAQGATRDPAFSKQSEGHDDVCALCEEEGELVRCYGKCKRAFHRACVPSNNPAPPAEAGAVPCRRRWLCSDCRSRRMRCFFCKRWGSTDDEVLRCTHRACGKFYHAECLTSSLQQFSAPTMQLAPPSAPSKRAAQSAHSAFDAEEDDEGNEEDDDAAAAEANRPWRPPEEDDKDGDDPASVAGGSKARAKPRAKDAKALEAAGCARHYCAHCLEPESTGYGKSMVRCVRCVTSYHRACMPRSSLTMITHHSFLCHRCYNNSPRGLNAPDPTLPPQMRGADRALEISGEDPSLAAFAHAKLALRANVEFETPAEGTLFADLLHALHARELQPCNGFAPTPYKTIKQSYYLHKKPREALPSTDSLSCLCTLSNGGCDENCQNKLMQQECLPSLCACGDACGNRPFSHRQESPLPLQLFKTAYKGWGVKVEQHVQEGELIVEYVGEVIDSETWEERKQQLSRFDHMYFMALNHNEIVDATRKGNIARFINHSCSPNLVVQKWFVNRIPRLGLFAIKDIPAGAEVTYNYSVKWSGDPDMAQRCYCGAPNCTGYLGPAPSSRG